MIEFLWVEFCCNAAGGGDCTFALVPLETGEVHVPGWSRHHWTYDRQLHCTVQIEPIRYGKASSGKHSAKPVEAEVLTAEHVRNVISQLVQFGSICPQQGERTFSRRKQMLLKWSPRPTLSVSTAVQVLPSVHLSWGSRSDRPATSRNVCDVAFSFHPRDDMLARYMLCVCLMSETISKRLDGSSCFWHYPIDLFHTVDHRPIPHFVIL